METVLGTDRIPADPGASATAARSLRLSVIVPVRDDPRIDDLLASLAAQRGAPPFEVIIALDGGRRRPRIPPGLETRILQCPPRGPYAARNAAVLTARGEILLFTDSDCFCPSDWIRRVVEAFEDPDLSALQGCSETFDHARLSRWVQTAYDRYVDSHSDRGYRHFCNTRNFAVRREIVASAPLPELFPRGGDVVYGRLLEARGISIRYEPGWRVAHRHPSSRRLVARQAFDQARWGARWSAVAEMNLFDSPSAGRLHGPGRWLLRNLPDGLLARRAASAGLLALGWGLALASAVLPEQPGSRLFSLFRRSCHLAGRLYGESEKAG